MIKASRLDEVCEIVMGQAPTGDSYNDGGSGWPLVAGAGDMTDGLATPSKFTTAPTKLSEQGDILIGIRASIGMRAIAEQTVCLGRGVAALRPGASIDGRYLWHWLGVVAPRLAAKGRGATFLQVNKQDIGELVVPLPPLDDQRRIARVLDTADELHAKRAGSIAVTNSLAPAWLDTTVGLPEASVVCRRSLAELVVPGDRINYGVLQPGEHVNDGVPLIRVGDLVGGRVRREGLKAIAHELEAPYARSRIVGTEILVSCVGSIGIVASTTQAEVGSNVARAIARIPLESPRLRTFVAAYLQTPAGSTVLLFSGAHRGAADPQHQTDSRAGDSCSDGSMARRLLCTHAADRSSARVSSSPPPAA